MKVPVAAGWAPGGDGAAGHRRRGAMAGGLLCGLRDERLHRMLVLFGARPYPDTQSNLPAYPNAPAGLLQSVNSPADVLVTTR